MTSTYQYARPALTVDCVVFGLSEQTLQVMLIERKLKPFVGTWALPGGFVRVDESVDDAVKRELREETGLGKVYLEQLYTFGQLDRDPRERTVSIAYYALVRPSEHKVYASTDATRAEWFSIEHLPTLAFDHRAIVKQALQRLQTKVRYQPIGFELLPRKFTLTQIQQLYEAILGRELDKRNFRKKILAMEILTGLEETQTNVAHRAAKLYSFHPKRYRELLQSGFHFEI
jgi:8-oxo-dGTP diphosphatase